MISIFISLWVFKSKIFFCVELWFLVSNRAFLCQTSVIIDVLLNIKIKHNGTITTAKALVQGNDQLKLVSKIACLANNSWRVMETHFNVRISYSQQVAIANGVCCVHCRWVYVFVLNTKLFRGNVMSGYTYFQSMCGFRKAASLDGLVKFVRAYVFTTTAPNM